MIKVGVSPLLSNVKKHLRAQGIDAVDFDDNVITRFGFAGDLQAVVIPENEMDLLGIQDTSLAIPVINATGRTPEEISQEIKVHLEQGNGELF